MNRKMKGDQQPTGGFDLDAFVNAGDPVKPPRKEGNAPAKPTKQERKQGAVNPVGRPPVAAEEARDQNVQVKLTKAELATLKQQAGLVPVSVYLRSKLQEQGII